MATTPSRSKTVVDTVAKPTPATQIKRLSEQLNDEKMNNGLIAEALTNAVMMLRQEDVGWALPGSTGYRGLNLLDTKRWSDQIRASLTGTFDKAPNPHMRNGLMLRQSFIWDGGMHYANIPGSDDLPAKQGQANVQKIIDSLDNQRLYFSSSARQRREHALYADGLYLVVGTGTGANRKLRPVPLHEITDMQASDYNEDEVIAYRWTRNVAQRVNGKLVGGRREESVWVYVDWYSERKADFITYKEGVREKVLKDAVAFDLFANRPEGQVLGSPDAIAALVWARIIRDLIMNGVKMQDALAMFAFKVSSPSKAGQKTEALELAKSTMAGSAATMAGENDLTSLNSAGKGYDFGSIGFVVATMAASLHVSGIALSANTALAGSSYGAAKTLDLPGRMAMETRRREHVEFEHRVLRWLGAPDATAYFDNFDDATDEYRSVQAAMLAWTTGTLSPEGFRRELEIIYGRALSGEIPAGAINPNTETKADKEAAQNAQTPLTTQGDQGPFTKKAPPRRAPATSTKSTPAPNQGKSDGTGGAGHANDLPVKP